MVTVLGASGDQDADAVTAVREILSDPAMPVGVYAAQPDGERLSALREAHDYISSARLVADSAANNRDVLHFVDGRVEKSLAWHAALLPVLASLPAGVARDALLGQVGRGDLLSWSNPTSLSWHRLPSVDEPFGQVSLEATADDFPELYDLLLFWDAGESIVLSVPTYTHGVSWVRTEAGPETRWRVTARSVWVHVDQVIRPPVDVAAVLDGPDFR